MMRPANSSNLDDPAFVGKRRARRDRKLKIRVEISDASTPFTDLEASNRTL
jgi:hypothetical protein